MHDDGQLIFNRRFAQTSTCYRKLTPCFGQAGGGKHISHDEKKSFLRRAASSYGPLTAYADSDW